MIEYISVVVYDSEYEKMADFESLEESIEYLERLNKTGCVLDAGLFWGDGGSMHNWSISSDNIKRMGNMEVELWISNYP